MNKLQASGTVMALAHRTAEAMLGTTPRPPADAAPVTAVSG